MGFQYAEIVPILSGIELVLGKMGIEKWLFFPPKSKL